jgi:thymidine phosphorylase
MAREVLTSGRAWRQFQAICDAQGGMREPPQAPYRRTVLAEKSGEITCIDNRLIARIAKLAGAPADKAAGLVLHTPVGSEVSKGDPLFTVHAETAGELDYALDYARTHQSVITIGTPT